MAYILLLIGLICIIYAKVMYNKRCTSGNGIPYTNIEKSLLYGGYLILGIAFLLAAFNKA